MATSTFYDNLVLSKEGTKRLAQVLREPPLPFDGKNIRHEELSDESLEQFFYNLKKTSSPMNSED
jgi:hypothetical protein